MTTKIVVRKLELTMPLSEQIKKCEHFAENCSITNADEYSKRNQFNIDKIKKDIYYGKIAEFSVFNYLISMGKKPTPPDLNIYDKHDKTFSADMITGTNMIHVKSCLTKTSWANSWVFQPNDKLTISPSNDDYLTLCVININFIYAYLLKALSVLNLYKPAIKKELNKKVIYEQDIKQILLKQSHPTVNTICTNNMDEYI